MVTAATSGRLERGELNPNIHSPRLTRRGGAGPARTAPNSRLQLINLILIHLSLSLLGGAREKLGDSEGDLLNRGRSLIGHTC